MMSRASAKLVMLNGWNRYGVLLTLGQAGAPSLGCILTNWSAACRAKQPSRDLALGMSSRALKQVPDSKNQAACLTVIWQAP